MTADLDLVSWTLLTQRGCGAVLQMEGTAFDMEK